MIRLGSGCPNEATLFYRESTDDSSNLHMPIDLYEACNKPEKAKEWRAYLAQMEDF